ncbi:hypothetical protein [Halopelagius longus]|uniref:Uncharacterized protein n=1 Tax=Halopelagius longus TaxID=1236180 RepID=A0A1H1BTV8_9EURY|nr:hypothetical protein [Halopelagius longus]RDI70923.1 hypothetical protein DWB78_03810 [Halopelagius longus]SDQ55378.1 hypothetical protein SAMN05216278_1951 [Halopelagius longus]
MKSGEHAVVGAVVGSVAAVLLVGTASLPLLAGYVAYAVLLSVVVDLDHFLLSRAVVGDWRHLELAVTNPRVGLIEQEKVFEGYADVLEPRRLLSHHVVGGVLAFGLAAAGLGTVAVFSAVVLYAHVLCDYLRDLGYA